jgi:hypothetical protein
VDRLVIYKHTRTTCDTQRLKYLPFTKYQILYFFLLPSCILQYQAARACSAHDISGQHIPVYSKFSPWSCHEPYLLWVGICMSRPHPEGGHIIFLATTPGSPTRDRICHEDISAAVKVSFLVLATTGVRRVHLLAKTFLPSLTHGLSRD